MKLKYLLYSVLKPEKKWDCCSEDTNHKKVNSKNNSEFRECPTPKDKNILNNYSDLFQGLGCIPGEHTIKLDSSIPAVVNPPRKVLVSIKDKIKE